MGDFRVRYGLAAGPYGAASAVSGAMQLPIDDTTPDVSTGYFFLTNNTGATAISYFDVLTPGGGVSNTHNGKLIKLLINDANTTIVNGGNIYLPGTNAALTTGTVVEFVFYNSGWYASSLVENLRSDVQSVTVLGTGAPSIADAKLLILTGSGGTTSVITGLSGGYPGQVVTIAKIATAVLTDTAMKLLSGTQLYLAGTNALVMSGSEAYTFICDVAPRFRLMSPGSVV